MSINIATKKILSQENIKRIISLGISIRDKLENAEKGLISEYDKTVTYARGMSCYYNNYLYECKYTTAGDFDESKWQKIGDELTEIDKTTLDTMLGLTTEQIDTISKIILDSEIRLDKTWSSSKIYTDIQQCLDDSKTYTLKELSKKMGASYKVVTTTSEVTSTEFLYLISNSTAYDIYALIDGVARKLGDTSIDLSQFYTKEQIDNDFLKKADADGKYATITTVDGKFDKANINTAISNTPSDEKVLSEKAIKSELDLKANDNEVIKRTDIKTTLDENSTNYDVCSGKAIFDVIKKNSGRFSYSTNEKITGDTWIDGKPIYRKVIVSTFGLSGGSSKRITLSDFGVKNVETPISCTFISDNGGSVAIRNDGGVYASFFIDAITVNTMSGWTLSSGTQKIIIEYTKKTN